jgi:extracellular solute-binding protein
VDCTGTWEAFLWSNGGSLLDLASDKAKQALELWVDLVQSGCASRGVVNWSGGGVADQFIGGRAAMMVSGPWDVTGDKAKWYRLWNRGNSGSQNRRKTGDGIGRRGLVRYED